ncbi:MAG: hypothetical protein AB1689_27240 [Thermodesulfobacteriota bacterium]
MQTISRDTARRNRPPAGRRARALLPVLGGLLLSVAAGEALVRLAATSLPGVRLLAEPLGTRRDEPQTFAELQHAYRDHVVPFREWNGFRCNSLGFHDVEFRREKAPGTLRIVALGDSFAYGSVTYGRCYLTLAEALLVLDSGDSGATAARAVEIDNLGVPASGIADYRVVWQLVGRDLAPDLVVVTLYLGNDPRDFADATRFGGPRRPWQSSWLLTFLRRSATLAAERWRVRRSDRTTPPAPPGDATQERAAPAAWTEDDRAVFSDEAFAGIQALELEMLARPGAALRGPGWDAFLAALAGLVDAVARDGVPVALALAPSRLQVHASELAAVAARARVPLEDLDPDLPQQRIAAFAAERGVPLVDLTPALRRAAATDGALYQRNDTHWNVRGNAVAGIELARRLVELGVVPPATARR